MSAGLYSNPPNCPSKSFHQTSTFCESRSALGGGNFIFFYVLALQVVFCDFSSGLPNTVFGISSCAPLPSIYYLWSLHPLPGNKENCLFVFLLHADPRGSLTSSQMKPCVRPVAFIHLSPGFCLLSLLFLNDAIGGKKASFLEKYKSSLSVFCFFFLFSKLCFWCPI